MSYTATYVIVGATWKWRNGSKSLYMKKGNRHCFIMALARVYTQWREILYMRLR